MAVDALKEFWHGMKSLGWVVGGLLVLSASAFADSLPPPSIIFNRPLPVNNLNEAAGNFRSNFSFTEIPDGDPLAFVNFDGDDFTLDPVANNAYIIDSISTWSVASNLGEALGVEFASVSLYMRQVSVDPVTHARTPVGAFQVIATGSPNQSFDDDSSTVGNSNPNITHTQVQYQPTGRGAFPQNYEGAGSPGTFYPLWMNTFSNLNLTVLAGQTYEFAVWGFGYPETQSADSLYGFWFNEFSNASLSGLTEAGADNAFLKFDASDLAAPGAFVNAAATGIGPKNVDLNVQITGVGVPEPATCGLLGLGLLGLGYLGRRRR